MWPLHRLCEGSSLWGCINQVQHIRLLQHSRTMEWKWSAGFLRCRLSETVQGCCRDKGQPPVCISDSSFGLKPLLCIRQGSILQTGSWTGVSPYPFSTGSNYMAHYMRWFSLYHYWAAESRLASASVKTSVMISVENLWSSGLRQWKLRENESRLEEYSIIQFLAAVVILGDDEWSFMVYANMWQVVGAQHVVLHNGRFANGVQLH